MRARYPTNDLISHQGASMKAGFDTDNTNHFLLDGGRAGIRSNAHETGDAVGEVADVFGGVDSPIAVATLSSNQEAISLFEPMYPTGRELRRVLFLVARQLVEDGLGLLTKLLVGGLAARGLDLLVPEENELLYVGPIAEAQARARELGIIAIEARVFGGERMGDGGLADLLSVLGVEPINAGLVRRSDGLGVGPAAKGSALVEGE